MIRKGIDYTDAGPGYAQYNDTYIVRKDFKGRTIVEPLGEPNATNYAKPQKYTEVSYQGTSHGVDISAEMTSGKSTIDPKGGK